MKSQPERDGTIFPLDRISVQEFRKGTESLLEAVLSRWFHLLILVSLLPVQIWGHLSQFLERLFLHDITKSKLEEMGNILTYIFKVLLR